MVGCIEPCLSVNRSFLEYKLTTEEDTLMPTDATPSQGKKAKVVLFYCEGLSSYLVLGPILDKYPDLISAVIRVPIIPKSVKTKKTPEKLSSNLNKSALTFKVYNVLVLYFYAFIARFGRGRIERKCAKSGITHMSFSSLDKAARNAISELKPDYIFNDGPNILTKTTLALARVGVVNFHAAPLPEYRGAGNYFWLLHNEVKNAKGTVHFVDSGLDTGPVIAFTEPVKVQPGMSILSFWIKMRLASHPVFEKLLESIRNDQDVVAIEQDHKLAVVRTFPTAEAVRNVKKKGFRIVKLQDIWQLFKVALTGRYPTL